jgi:hypothetical protein
LTRTLPIVEFVSPCFHIREDSIVVVEIDVVVAVLIDVVVASPVEF